jgi:hypothetical protein
MCDLRDALMYGRLADQVPAEPDQSKNSEAAAELDFIARKSFTGSAAVTQAASSLRADPPPSGTAETQHSLLGLQQNLWAILGTNRA